MRMQMNDDDEEEEEEEEDSGSDLDADFDQEDLDGRINGQVVMISNQQPASPLSESANKDSRRPPIWQSVGNVSGQAVTFKGKAADDGWFHFDDGPEEEEKLR